MCLVGRCCLPWSYLSFLGDNSERSCCHAPTEMKIHFLDFKKNYDLLLLFPVSFCFVFPLSGAPNVYILDILEQPFSFSYPFCSPFPRLFSLLSGDFLNFIFSSKLFPCLCISPWHIHFHVSNAVFQLPTPSNWRAWGLLWWQYSIGLLRATSYKHQETILPWEQPPTNNWLTLSTQHTSLDIHVAVSIVCSF